MRRYLISLLVFPATFFGSSALSQQVQPFLSSPLDCAEAACITRYVQGVYTPQMINTVVDHSMKQNSNGAWPFGRVSNGGGDGIVIAFNGERSAGELHPRDETCTKGSIFLKPTPSSPDSTAMVAQGKCPSGVTGYASYDEHPGYDYIAAMGTPVKAAASGTVVNIGGQRCFLGNTAASCAAMGYIGIDHGNGYITQYGHMSRIDLVAGATVTQGQVIGLSGTTGLNNAPHLHFEVLKKVGSTYYYVDPYGWVGSYPDPLYSVVQAGNPKLWK
jgi:murein DD-endopeptidase MepM/ murein hydrolase activator NlpD